MSGTVSKIAAERNQKALLVLATKPGNDLCADCKTRNPRWASHNLGIFICVNCASVHRKIGTHISKVKSLTMDLWTKEQVEHMRQIGNTKSNELYNADEVRHPPPTNTIDGERDSDLERFIRDKYEFKRFVNRIDRSAVVASHLGPSRSASSVRSSTSSSFPPSPSWSQTLPPPKPSLPPASSAPTVPTHTPRILPSTPASTTMSRSVSQPMPPPGQSQPPPGGVWSDLASLQGPTQTSTLPLQYVSTISPSEPLSNANPTIGVTTLGTNFTLASSNIGVASQGPIWGPSGSPGTDILGRSVSTPPVQSPFVLGASGVNPFAQMAAQRQAQAQAQQYHLLSPFGTSLSQQPSFSPHVQQPAFSQSVTNPFFNSAARSLTPQPQPQFMSATPSPVPFTGSPFQQPVQIPLQQQPLSTPTPFQSQPPPFGNVQSSGTPVGNPFTSWLTQQPGGYASTHVGQGVNGQWGSM